jgi:hypothetical protein
VTVSRGGHWFGGRGALGIRFDSLLVAPDKWVGVTAVLDTLEYTPTKRLTDSGVAYGSRGSMAKRAVPVAIAGVSDIAMFPVVVLGGFWMARRGASARVIAGEIGGMRLAEPLRVRSAAACLRASATRALPAIPTLPAFAPRTETKSGRLRGDPVNLIVLGDGPGIEAAFGRAGWVGPKRGSVGTVTKEIVAGLTNHQAIGAPLSTQYFQGRRQDLAYELAGPNARLRHHARLWVLDSVPGVWVGAATHDVGVRMNPFIGRFTHRISRNVDRERDRIVKELEATGCADLVDYVTLPGATTWGRNATGQTFITDGRAAVISVRPCEASGD